MLANAKQRLLNYLLRHLMNAVTEDDCLTFKNGLLIHKGQPLSSVQTREIIGGAETILQLETWRILQDSLKWEANKRLYHTSTTVDDMVFAKAMLYTLDVLEKKLYNLTKLQ